jgi:hypothetical protein
MPDVSGGGQHLKIRGAIVEFIAVNVRNDMTCWKRTQERHGDQLMDRN